MSETKPRGPGRPSNAEKVAELKELFTGLLQDEEAKKLLVRAISSADDKTQAAFRKTLGIHTKAEAPNRNKRAPTEDGIRSFVAAYGDCVRDEEPELWATKNLRVPEQVEAMGPRAIEAFMERWAAGFQHGEQGGFVADDFANMQLDNQGVL